MADACENCRWFTMNDITDANMPMGLCRAGEPTFTQDATLDPHAGCWPKVRAVDWCAGHSELAFVMPEPEPERRSWWTVVANVGVWSLFGAGLHAIVLSFL